MADSFLAVADLRKRVLSAAYSGGGAFDPVACAKLKKQCTCAMQPKGDWGGPETNTWGACQQLLTLRSLKSATGF